MKEYVKVTVSTASSIDGFLNDTSDERLILSSEDDFYEIHQLRSQSDAILVGSETIRKDNPSLNVRFNDLRFQRESLGLNPDPIKVTLTNTGDIDINSNFFKKGSNRKIVICSNLVPIKKINLLKSVSEVFIVGDTINSKSIISYMQFIGVKSLLVEGGSEVLNMFFIENSVDEFRHAVSPFFLGEVGSTRIFKAFNYPFNKEKPMKITKVYNLNGTIVTWYNLM